jgi:hypothetical protein
MADLLCGLDTPSTEGMLIMIVIYIVAAAVVICGCAFIMKARSRG